MSTNLPITRNDRRVDFLAAAGQTVFGPTDFALWEAADVRVFLAPAMGAVFSQLLTGFTVTPSGAYPCSVSVTVPAQLAGAVVRVDSARQPERLLDVTRAGAIDTAAIEREFDRIATTSQEMRRDLDDLLSKFAQLDGLTTSLSTQAITATGPVTLIDAAGGQDVELTLAADTALGVANAPAAGSKTFNILVKQDATGGRILSIGAAVIRPGRWQPAIDTAALAESRCYMIVKPGRVEFHPGPVGLQQGA